MSKFQKKSQDIEKLPLDASLFEWFHEYGNDLSDLNDFEGATKHDFYEWLLEKPDYHEKQQIRWTKPKNNADITEQYLHWSYGDRIIYCAKKYQLLSKRERDYIIKCRKKDIYWRGDDIEAFMVIVKETLKFRLLTPIEKAKYKKSAKQRLLSIKKAA